MDIHHPGIDVTLGGVSPDLAQNLPPAEGLSGAADQQLQKAEFHAGEPDALAALEHLTLVGVDAQVADLDHPGAGDAGDLLLLDPAQHAADAGLELLGAERFDHVVVGPQFQAGDAIRHVAEGGEHHDRHIGILAQLLADAIAIESGHHHVQHHQIRQALAEEFQGLFAVAGGDHLVADHRQPGFQDAPDTGLVVHDEDGFPGGGGRGGWGGRGHAGTGAPAGRRLALQPRSRLQGLAGWFPGTGARIGAQEANPLKSAQGCFITKSHFSS